MHKAKCNWELCSSNCYSKPPLTAPPTKDRDMAGNVRWIAVALNGGFPMVDGNGQNPPVELCVLAGPRRALAAAITLHYTLYFLLQFADTR